MSIRLAAAFCCAVFMTTLLNVVFFVPAAMAAPVSALLVWLAFAVLGMPHQQPEPHSGIAFRNFVTPEVYMEV